LVPSIARGQRCRRGCAGPLLRWYCAGAFTGSVQTGDGRLSTEVRGARLWGMTNGAGEETLTIGEQRVGWAGRRAERVEREALFDLLFRQHYPALLRLGVVMVGNREAAEDAVQDAFVALHRHWSSLDDPQAAESYLRSAVLNRCRSWVRRRVTEAAPRPLALVDHPERTPEDASVHREETGSLVAAMRTLPRRQREVLACRYVLELSVAETSELLGISEGSVKTHTHRGLESLNQRIEVAR
jgi:RNA polymerase sigma-70 factor (sigma-E family)